VVALDNELARHVAEGLIRSPTPEAYELAKASPNNAQLKDLSTRLLMATASALTAANQKQSALQLYAIVRDSHPSAELIPQLARGMTAAGANVDLQGLMGTITHWWVVGPFELGKGNAGWDADYVGEPNISLAARYMSGKRRVEWKAVTSREPNGKIDLRKTVADSNDCIGYAYTEVALKQPTEAVLLLGVDDSEKVWVNGKLVYNLFTPRGLTCDQDKIPVKLEAGANRILLKIWQNTMGWEFCARLTTADGKPLSFTQGPERASR
jgi:hypothetical protein